MKVLLIHTVYPDHTKFVLYSVLLYVRTYIHLYAVPVEAILLEMETVQREVDLTGVSEVHSKVGSDRGSVVSLYISLAVYTLSVTTLSQSLLHQITMNVAMYCTSTSQFS